MTRLRIGITIGDPGGIGPEVTLAALAELEQHPPQNGHGDGPQEVYLIGPGALWAQHTDLLRQRRPDLASALAAVLDRAIIVQSDDQERGAKAKMGATSPRNGRVAATAVERAVTFWREGQIDALVTAPLSKEGLSAAGSPYPGHTEMLRDLTESPDVAMMLVGGGLRVGLVTIHMSLLEAIRRLTPGLVLAKARLLSDFLEMWLGERPVIGVCGVNPHAGEKGLFGDEEEQILKPAIAEGRRQGLSLDGPHPADTIYYEHLRGHFDAVLAMYHDQGLIPVKTLAFDSGVNVSMGLPLIRTSPDHGTAFSLAGKGKANPSSMKAAILLAADLARAQQEHRGRSSSP